MTLHELLQQLGLNISTWAEFIFIISFFIEIAPIRISPFSAIFKWIGNTILGDIPSKIEELMKVTKDLYKYVKEVEFTTSRYRILRFDDELIHGLKHTQEHFNQIKEDINVYRRFCLDNPNYKNGIADGAINHILEVDARCQREHSYL
ncbi:hypothetical protein SAMN05216249_10443 [Acetitomaculum ruminis DSM 5522]|uniref:Uncharacterized protein n=1 Tax=Acetitomaculum ruminis DSM 5522 TaxID=1120918 RepID=A0A1I0WH58_9FIRM|nr:hypothetical protein [Acetitomaculum ruminis]SFA87276.1 hypothetical protein SAMN05216249_10443 [Acetitomaculum ruminis DSM 5522]